jgi:hypothetical protein
MSKDSAWDFVSTNGAREDGIHNPMIEHFSGNYNYSLAREVIQNSLDAKQDGSISPVTVSFSLQHFSRSEFPGYSELLEVLKACKKYWPDDRDTQEFVDNALEYIKEDSIPFLKISDYNTKGLVGLDDEKTGGWYNLVKSTGASSKSEGQGGSFGIGKGAPFAASNLRVVFYSTRILNGFTKFQGVAELVSFKVGDDIKRGVGSFGLGQNSVQNLRNIPERFRRTETGTDIFIAGYKNEKGWQKNLIKSILRNFWFAINSGDLVVNVESTEIDRNNIEKLLTDHFLGEPFKDSVKPAGNPLQYHKAILSGKMFEDKLPILGTVRFYFYQTEEQLNYVAMLRKSHMVIYSRRFTFPGNYAGVFICDDDKGNKELRKMEPPAHDEWIEERNKERGLKAMAEVVSFIRGCLDKMKLTKTSGILDIPELHKYLPYDDGAEVGVEEGASQYTGTESETESSRVIQRKESVGTPVVISPFKVAVVNIPDSGWRSEGRGSGSGGNGGGQERGSGGGGGKKKSFRRDEVSSRAFLTKRSDEILEYLVIVKSTIGERCNLRLSAVGEEGLEKVRITNVTDLDGSTHHFLGNNIHNIQLRSGGENRLNISISSRIKYSLKIDAYALQ